MRIRQASPNKEGDFLAISTTRMAASRAPGPSSSARVFKASSVTAGLWPGKAPGSRSGVAILMAAAG